MLLADQVICSFQAAKVFPFSPAEVTSLSFATDGQHSVLSTSDDRIVLHDCQSGQETKTINSKKYGVGKVEYSHGDYTILHTATRIDNHIRYLSLHDNKYLCYFKGHEKSVTSIKMSPRSDTFLSGSLDGTVKFWDIRSPNCQGQVVIHETSSPICAYDHKNELVAIAEVQTNGSEQSLLKIYDLKQLLKGPVKTYSFENIELGSQMWTDIEFSPDDKSILISTNLHNYLLDINKGQISTKYLVESGNNASAGCFSPDGQYVFGGTAECTILCWNRHTGALVTTLEGHTNPVTSVKFNPHIMLLASGCENMAYWVPKNLN